jgi:hypothetical protein
LRDQFNGPLHALIRIYSQFPIRCPTETDADLNLELAVAMILDGHIAGPNGEYDWIGTDPEVDFAAIWSQFDVCR